MIKITSTTTTNLTLKIPIEGRVIWNKVFTFCNRWRRNGLKSSICLQQKEIYRFGN